MLHTVIIPRFDPREAVRTFLPQVVKIKKGDSIRWINADTLLHSLVFFVVAKSRDILLPIKLDIKPRGSEQMIFNYNYKRIDYRCAYHNNEINSVVFLSESQVDMSNTQRLRFLSKTFNIRPPKLMEHLDGTR